jgi:hypothetical protein
LWIQYFLCGYKISPPFCKISKFLTFLQNFLTTLLSDCGGPTNLYGSGLVTVMYTSLLMKLIINCARHPCISNREPRHFSCWSRNRIWRTPFYRSSCRNQNQIGKGNSNNYSNIYKSDIRIFLRKNMFFTSEFLK